MTWRSAWTCAALATAVLAHGLIGLAGRFAALGGAADDYAERPHVALGPLALGALLALAVVALRIGLAAARRRERGDPLIRLARRLDRGAVPAAAAALAIGGGTILVASELVEQRFAEGRVLGVADALGGHVVVGIALIVLAAFVVAFGGRLVAHTLVAAALAGARFVEAILARVSLRPGGTVLHRARRPRRRRSLIAFAFVRTGGERAPPSPSSAARLRIAL